MIPIFDDRLLPKDQAAYANNCFLQAGYLSPFSALVPVHTVAGTTRYVFRIPKAGYSIDNIADSYWLEFQNPDTTVVRYPVVGADDDGRYYWADGQNAPGYTTGARVAAGSPRLKLGIPRPSVAPTVSVGGGSGVTETRAYVYTWVSSLGEEGQPSAPTVTTGYVNGTWNITVTPPGAGDLADRVLDKVRIYRTVTSAQGIATYYRVTEFAYATTTYADTIPDGTVVENPDLQSTTWYEPPHDLVEFVAMPNGIIASFRNNEVWFCEPYRPHAWPTEYVIGVETPIIGLGVFGQSLVICTAGQPYIATGVHPSVMTLSKAPILEPCTFHGSIVSATPGVMYSSPNGLVLIGPGTSDVVTKNLVRKDEWSQLLNPKNLRASFINVPGAYYCYSGVVDGCFQQTPEAFQGDAFQFDDYSGTHQGGLIVLGDTRMGYMIMKTDNVVYNVIQDLWTAEVFLLSDGKVFHVDLRQNYPRQRYLWRSKVFQQDYRHNYGAAKIFWDNPPGPVPDAPTYFRFYADGEMVFEETLTVPGQVFRLPSGFKYNTVQWEIEGELVIHNVQIATSVRELRQV
jgi:hypothetical protein